MPKDTPQMPTVYAPTGKKGKKKGRKSHTNKNQRRQLEELEDSLRGGPKTGAR